MRVFALGGSGGVGQGAARILAASNMVSEIAITSRSLSIAKQVATGLGEKATAVEVDATDEERLALLMRGYDLVVNTAGPDFQMALPAARASLRAGAHCCDISADGPTTEKILMLDAEAKASGLTVLTGIGAEPGLSNLLMLHAARQLDQVEEVQFCACYPFTLLASEDPGREAVEMRSSGRINASWQTLLKWVSGGVRTYRNGRWIDIEPFDSAVEVSLPQGATATMFPYGSTEPITLPRYLPGVKTVSVLACLSPPQVNELYRVHARRLGAGEVDAAEATLNFLEAVGQDTGRWLATPKGFPSHLIIWASAIGRKDGRKARAVCQPTSMWLSTAGAVSVAALRILRGEIKERGVLPPEACLDPLPFFADVAQHGFEEPKGKLLHESLELLD